MRSLGELGIGLSIVFGIFLFALLAELWYIFSWKKSGSTRFPSAYRLRSGATQRKAGRKLHRSNSEFVREASLVGSFGGYPSCTSIEAGDGSDSTGPLGNFSHSQAPHLLFPIKEETKEEMELAAGVAGAMKPNSRLRSRTPSDVFTIPFTSGSSSPAASVDTPFTTPPSSPPPPATAKLSPYAACAVRPMSCSTWASSSPSRTAESYGASGIGSRPVPVSLASNAIMKPSGRTPLRLLFERSPLSGPAAALNTPLPLQPVFNVSAGRDQDSDAASSPHFYQRRLSLAAVFRQSSSCSPCLPL